MTNAFNPHASCQVNGPAAALVEQKLIRWLCDRAGYPEGSGGLFVSGGSIANLTALTAARDAKLTYEQRASAVVYVSDQTHSSVAKGLLIIGFRPDQIRKIPTDALFRMDLSALQAAIAADIGQQRHPFAVVASAGTTNTGSVDPLPEIAALCRQYGLWMHVDGAFGASALLSEQHKRDLAGIELSDSLSWDAHKWLLQTYGCSMVLVRDQSLLSHSFAAHPEYLKDAESAAGAVEFWDLGPELTRPARALKLWLTLQVLGSQAVGRVIDHGCVMAELAEQRLRSNPAWQIVCPAQLGDPQFPAMWPMARCPTASWTSSTNPLPKRSPTAALPKSSPRSFWEKGSCACASSTRRPPNKMCCRPSTGWNRRKPSLRPTGDLHTFCSQRVQKNSSHAQAAVLLF